MESVKNFFKNKFNIFCLCLISLNAILTFCMARRIGNSLVTIGLIILVELIVEIAAIFLFTYINKRKKHLPLEKKFLILAIPLGLLFTFILPAEKTPDAIAHITRTFDVSYGHIISDTDEEGNPQSYHPSEIAYIKDGDDYKIEFQPLITLSGETSTHPNSATSSNSFLLYLPQAIGLFIGRILHLPLIAILWLGRLFGFVVFLIMTYFAIKMLPRYKLLLAFIALFPMTIQLTTAFSSDTIIFGLSFLTVAYALKLYFSKKPLNNKQIIAIYALAIATGICRPLYLPLFALFLMIPYRQFGSKKRKWLNVAGALTLTAGATFLCMKLLQPASAGVSFGDGENLNIVLHSPLSYFNYFFSTLTDIAPGFYLSSIFGTSLGAFEFPSPTIYFYIALIFSVLVLSRGIERTKIIARERIAAIFIIVSIVVAFLTIVFISWTEPGLTYVEGVQGRYFIPILLLIPFLLTSCSEKQKPTLEEKYPLLFCTFFSICAITCVFILNCSPALIH